MPTIAAFIDAFRAEFGAEGINAVIRGGLRGTGDFWASENGMEIGSRKSIDPAKCFTAAQMVIRKPEAQAAKSAR